MKADSRPRILWLPAGPGFDPASHCKRIESLLQACELEATHSPELGAARASLESETSHVAVLASQDTPETLEFTRTLRAAPRFASMPVIYLTTPDWSGARLAAVYEAGATDHLSMPSEPAIVKAKFGHLSRSNQVLLDFRRTADLLPQIIWLSGVDGAVHYLNASGLEYAGSDASLERGWVDFIHPDDQRRVIPQIDAALRKQQAFESEYRLKRGDGIHRWFHSHVQPIRNAQGTVTAWLGTCTDIEENRQAELILERKVKSRTLELAKSERFLDSLIEHIPNMVFVKEARDLKFVRFNKAGEELLGIRMDELLGKSDHDFFPPEQAEAFISKDREVLSGRTVVNVPVDPINTRAHGHRILHTKKIPIPGEDGQPQYLLGISEDVTDKLAAEDALKRSKEDLERLVEERTKELNQKESQLRLITDSLPSLIAYVDRDYRYLFMNNTFRLWFERDPSSIIGKTVSDLLGERAFLERKPHYDAAFEGRGSTQVFQPIKTAQGLRDAQVHYVPDPGETGTRKGCIVLVNDTTEETKIRKNIEFLAGASTILSSSLDYPQTLQSLARLAVPKIADLCVVEFSESGTRTPIVMAMAHADPEMLPIAWAYREKYPTDWEASRGPGNVFRTGRSEIYSDMSEHLHGAVPDRERRASVERLQISSGMFVPIRSRDRIMGCISFIATDSGRKFSRDDLVFAEDLSHRAGVAVENALLYRRSEQQSLELKRAVQARDEFMSICSHELKTPITSLKIQAELATRQLLGDATAAVSPARVRKLVDTTQRQVDRMSRLIEDMLDISRISSGKFTMEMRPTELGGLVREVLDRLAEQLEASGVQATLEVKAPLVVQADRYRIEQVVTNLLTNAIRYGEGRPVEFILSLEPSPEGPRGRILVRDHGIGIKPENIERIFQRFERAVSASNISGLGLGLYIVRQIVEAHQGKVHVESKPGEGSDFIVDLPLLVADGEPPA